MRKLRIVFGCWLLFSAYAHAGNIFTFRDGDKILGSYVSPAVVTNYWTDPNADYLLARYDFEGTAWTNDTSGSGRHLRLGSQDGIYWTQKALGVNVYGRTESVTTNSTTLDNAGFVAPLNMPITNASAFTVSGWWYAKQVTANFDTMWGVSDYDNESTCMLFRWFPSGGGLLVALLYGGTAYGISNSIVAPTNQWLHHTIVYDGSQPTDATKLKYYQNGVLQSMVQIAAGIPTKSPAVTVPFTLCSEYRTAGTPGNCVRQHYGMADGVKIYSKALTSNDVWMLSQKTDPRNNTEERAWVDPNERALGFNFSFDSNWVDRVSGVEAVRSGGPAFTNDAVKGTAARFWGNASNSYARVLPSRTNFTGSSAHSMSLWFKVINWAATPPAAADSGICISSTNTVYPRNGLGFTDETGYRSGIVYYVSSTASNSEVWLTYSLVTGKWYHAVGTWDGTPGDCRARIYLNGGLRGIAPYGKAGTMLQPDYYYLAHDVYQSTRHSNIILDDVRDYTNKCLTRDDVTNLYYSSGSWPFWADTNYYTAYWSMDTFYWTASTINDWSGGNDNTLTGVRLTQSDAISQYGDIQKKYYFNGSTDGSEGYAYRTNLFSGQSNITVGGWVYFQRYNDYTEVLIGQGVLGGDAVLFANSGVNPPQSTNDFRFAVGGGNYCGTTNQPLGAYNTWYHLAATFDGSQTGTNRYKLYLNGIQQNKVIVFGSATVCGTNNAMFCLGKSQLSPSRNLMGGLADTFVVMGNGAQYTWTSNQVYEYSQYTHPTNNLRKGLPPVTYWTDPNSSNLLAKYNFETMGLISWTNDTSGNGKHLGLRAVDATYWTPKGLGPNRYSRLETCATNSTGSQSSGFVAPANIPITNASSFTVAGWWYTKTVTSNGDTMWAWQDYDNENLDFIVFRWYPNAAGIVMAFRYGGAVYGISNSVVGVTNQWTHHTVVYDGSQPTDATKLKYYQNGVLQSMLPLGAGIPTKSPIAAAPFTLCSEYRLSSLGCVRQHYGMVDGVKIYSTALSSNDIWTLSQQTNPQDNRESR